MRGDADVHADARVERVVARLWQQLLGQTPDPDTDFFDLGGDSVVAARLTTRVNKELAVRADLSLIFENRRFQDYVGSVTGLTSGALSEEAGAAPDPPDLWSTELSFNQRKRLNAIARRLRAARSPVAKNAALVLDVRGEFDATVLKDALGDVIRRQPALRMVFDISGPQPRWREEEKAAEAFCLTHRRVPADRAADWSETVYDMLATPIAVDSAPLMRGELLTVDDRQLLVLVLDHLICDGVSMEVLRRDLMAAYRARTTGEPLPEAAFSMHPQRILAERDSELTRDPEVLLGRCRAALDGLVNPPEFDLTPDRPALPLPRAAEHRVLHLSGAKGRQLLDRCREYGCSETAMALAGVYLALNRTTGVEDLPLVLASARRETPESENMVDWFADLLVVRARTAQSPGGLPLGEVVRSLQDAMWDALRRALSFNVFLNGINGVPLDGKADLPWVLVSYLKAAPAEVLDCGISLTPVRLPATSVNFHGPSIEFEADDSGLRVHVTVAAGRYVDGVLDEFVASLGEALVTLATRPWR